LKIKKYDPKSLANRAPPAGSTNGRRRVSGDLLPILLNGGCGYEEPQSRSLLADKRGLDQLFDLMDESLRFEPADNYPPCNIVRTGEDSYRISLAVAGFKPEQVSVSVHQNTLTVSGRVNEKQGETEYLYRGIAAKPFERRFSLADFVEVKGASFEDGLLQIELKREVPESMKPRKIEIQVGKPLPSDKAKTIEHAKVA